MNQKMITSQTIFFCIPCTVHCKIRCNKRKYFQNRPKGDNTDWRKDIAPSNKSYVFVGNFNAHAPFGEKTDVH